MVSILIFAHNKNYGQRRGTQICTAALFQQRQFNLEFERSEGGGDLERARERERDKDTERETEREIGR